MDIRDIAVLNRIVVRLIDSADAYHEASEMTDDLAIRWELERVERERRRLCTDLQDRIRALGGRPVVAGSWLDATLRSLLAVRRLLQDNVLAVISDIERREDRLMEEFDRMMSDRARSASERQFIQSVYQHIKLRHDHWSTLQRQFQIA